MKNLFKLFGIIALVAIIGFSMSACKDPEPDPDTVPSAWQGTWNGNGGVSGQTITFTGTTVKWEGGGDSFTAGTLVFTAETNAGTNNGTYPNGYRITGKITAITGDGRDYSVGENLSVGLYINTGGNRIARATDGSDYFQK